jgi:lipase (class 3)
MRKSPVRHSEAQDTDTAMDKSPQDRAPEPASASADLPKTFSPDLSKAASVTLIIHGVGDASSDTLLKAAAAGYVASGLGQSFERSKLAQCPVLWGQEGGAECLVLDASERSHVLIALPWARRRVRLSFVARLGAGMLLGLALLAAVTFAFVNPLEFIVEWLRPVSHRALAYFVMIAISVLAYVFNSDKQKKFELPPISVFVWPPLLLLAVMFFVDEAWLWVLIGLPLVLLGLMSMIIIGRCIRIAPTFGWRLALIGLLVAITLPNTALVRIARKYELRWESSYASVHDHPVDDAPLTGRHRGRLSGAPASDRNKDQPDALISTAATPPAATDDVPDLETHERESKTPVNVAPNLIGPNRMWGSGPIQWHFHLKWSDLVTWSDVWKELIVMAALALLCLGMSAYSWLLDFGFDILQYTGKERLRTSLIESVGKAMRWIHEQAPNAPILVVGHSLGSVLAAHAVASLSPDEPCLKRTSLVTMGSSLNYLSRAFPSSVQAAPQLSETMCERVRWINFWRRRDPVGKKLNIGGSAVQYSVGSGGHPNYWSDSRVWKAVACEGLGAQVDECVDSGHPEFCIFERQLGTLVAAAVLMLMAFGAALWAIAL